MSQRMEFDETNRQQQERPFDNYDAGYRDPFMGTFGAQKIAPQAPSGRGPSAGQRLALAIVSLCLLVPISAIILGISTGAGGFFGLTGGLIALGAVCLTIMVVNVVFNRRP